MLKGVAATLNYVAWNTSTGLVVTGDVANHVIYIIADGTAVALADVYGSEVDATHAPGVYSVALTAGEMNYNCITVCGKSTTANVIIIPTTIVTETAARLGDAMTLHSDYDAAKAAASVTLVTAIQTALTNGTLTLSTLYDAAKAAASATLVTAIQTALTNGTLTLHSDYAAAKAAASATLVTAIQTALTNGTLTLSTLYDAAKAAASATLATAIQTALTNGTITLHSDYAAAKTAASATALAALQKIIEADVYVDKTTTPWELVVLESGTASELFRKKLYRPDSSPVTATSHLVGRQLENAP